MPERGRVGSRESCAKNHILAVFQCFCFNGSVSWTVDIPKVLPDLPPLPDGIRERFEDVIARPAGQQPSWDRAQADNVRKILESVPPIVLPPEVYSLKSQLAQAANGEAFCSKAETVQSLLRPILNRTSAETSKPCCKWQWS